jgi:hypothetical protein
MANTNPIALSAIQINFALMERLGVNAINAARRNALQTCCALMTNTEATVMFAKE